MNMLVTKNMNDWLIVQNKNAGQFFSYHQLFVDKLIAKYFLFKFTVFNIRNINRGVKLELLYPFSAFRSMAHSTLMNNNYFITNQYLININLIHSLHKRFFQKDKPGRIDKPDITGDVQRHQRFFTTTGQLQKAERMKTRSIVEKNLYPIEFVDVIKPDLMRICSTDDSLSNAQQRQLLKTYHPELVVKPDLLVSDLKPGILSHQSMKEIKPILISEKSQDVQIPKTSVPLKLSMPEGKLKVGYPSKIHLSDNKPEREVSSGLAVERIENDELSKNYSLSYAANIQHSHSNQKIPVVKLKSDMLVSGLSDKNFLTIVPKLQMSLGFKPDFFSEMQLFYSKSVRKLTPGLAAKNAKENQISKDFLLFHSTNRQHTQGNQTFKIPEFEYSYLMPKLAAVTKLTPAESGIAGKEVLQPIAKNKAGPLKKEADLVPNANSIDFNRMADQVYRLIEKKIQIEHERSGRWY